MSCKYRLGGPLSTAQKLENHGEEITSPVFHTMNPPFPVVHESRGGPNPTLLQTRITRTIDEDTPGVVSVMCKPACDERFEERYFGQRLAT